MYTPTSIDAMIRSSEIQDVLIDQIIPVEFEYEGTVS